MADVVNTDTKDLIQSVNEGLSPYNAPPWRVITRNQYDLWALIPQRYRKWVTDHIEEMTDPEKSAVDAALLAALRDQTVQQLDLVEDVMRAVVLVIRDELNLHATKIKGILDAIDAGSSVATIKTGIAAITDPPQRSIADLRAAVRAKLGS